MTIGTRHYVEELATICGEKRAHYISELIQTAAVAVAAAENELYGRSDCMDAGQTNMILNMISAERDHQDEKWGPQNHDRVWWMVVLGEEFGETCKAAFELGKPKEVL